MLRLAAPLTAFAVFASCGEGAATAPAALDPPSSEGGSDPALAVDGASVAEPSLDEPAPVSIDEEVEVSIPLRSRGIRRFDAKSLPPGAAIDRRTGTITFRPDFTQSGTYDVVVTGYGGAVSPGEPTPAEGYPTKRDLFTGGASIVVDVTPRRTHSFRPLDGETVRWRFGKLQGTATASADGSVTVPALPITTTPTSLELERDPP